MKSGTTNDFLGYNYRMTEIQAALGLSQLKRIGSFISKRHKIAKTYFAELEGLNLFCLFKIQNVILAFIYFQYWSMKSVVVEQKQVYRALHTMGVAMDLITYLFIDSLIMKHLVSTWLL